MRTSILLLSFLVAGAVSAQSLTDLPRQHEIPAVLNTGDGDSPTSGHPVRTIRLKSNLLPVATALVANLGFELELARHWSLDLPVYYSPYNLFKETRKVRLLAVQPEVRYWFSDVSRRSHFVGLHGHVAGFNVAVNENGRYQDPDKPAWGLGVSYGYSMPLGEAKRWGLEFTLGAGFVRYRYDAYRNWENGPLYHSDSGTYWGITRAGISLSYQWNSCKKHQK